MGYSNEKLDSYSSSIYSNSLFEIFGEYAFTSSLSLRPGFKFTTRGQHIKESGLKYELDAKYTELTVPVVYSFEAIGSTGLLPYVLGGPALGFARGGSISIAAGSSKTETEINTGNLSSFAFGLYAGAGIKRSFRINEYFTIVPGFEMGYHLGLTDTYGEKDDVDGTRKHRGFECGVTLSIPLWLFKIKPPKPEPVPEPVVLQPVVLLPEPEPEPEKLCYTIEEMKELIRLRQNIYGKKICAVKQVSFKTGSTELTAGDKVYLDEMVALMQTNELMKIRVNGHTDNVGSEDFNTNLSRGRAKAVHDYLKSRGIAADRLSFAYFGPTRPIADNNTEEGRAINRRVEFEIINQ